MIIGISTELPPYLRLTQERSSAMGDQAALDLQDRRRERRENVAYATVAVFGLLGTTAALIAALSHGIPQ
jgi:hypothetical protein